MQGISWRQEDRPDEQRYQSRSSEKDRQHKNGQFFHLDILAPGASLAQMNLISSCLVRSPLNAIQSETRGPGKSTRTNSGLKRERRRRPSTIRGWNEAAMPLTHSER